MVNGSWKFFKMKLTCLLLWGILVPVFNLSVMEAVAGDSAWAASHPESEEREMQAVKPLLTLEGKLLEGRLKDQRLLGRLEEKLFRLDDERRSLIFLLANRVDEGKAGFRADIAFLLMTMLIILS